MLKVRKIKPPDKARAIEITKNIWDGDDYIYRVFDKWVKDKEGELKNLKFQANGLEKVLKKIQGKISKIESDSKDS